MLDCLFWTGWMLILAGALLALDRAAQRQGRKR